MVNPLLALALAACAPRYADLGPLPPEQLWSPLPTKHVEIDGIDIAYVDSGGDGPPLVFVHGLSSYTAYWEYQLPAFAKKYRVLALDLPGYGASARPDAPCTPPWYADLVSSWMDVVGAPRATVIGHSMGGQIALTLALNHPGRVSALVLSAPAGFESFSDGERAWMKSYWHEGRALESSEMEVRAAFTQAVFNVTDDGVERLLEERVRMGKTPEFRGTSVAVSRSIAGMVDFPVKDRLGELAVPTLIVYGTDDRMIPNPILHGGRTRGIAEIGHEAIADSELVMIPGAGHTVHHDAADAWNEAVEAFLSARGGAR
jgi:pimeloyl-ACP methyl ester carboxylesterase